MNSSPGRNLENENGVGHPGGQPIEALDSPGDVTAGIFRQEIAPKQLRVQPLLHPEDLLPHVVIDDIRTGPCLQVGQEEDDGGEDPHHQQVKTEIIRQPWPPQSKKGFWDLFARGKSRKVSVLGAESSHQPHDSQIFGIPPPFET